MGCMVCRINQQNQKDQFDRLNITKLVLHFLVVLQTIGREDWNADRYTQFVLFLHNRSRNYNQHKYITRVNPRIRQRL